MSKPKQKPFPIFYSWQSDLPYEFNGQLIRGALDEASTALTDEGALGVIARCDEATRDEPGSPKIADTIFAKIRKSDVFVCDISKVHETENAEGEVRKFCNPNVAIELGYAIRELGWERIILVFNEAYGKLPHDLPFDAQGNRTTKYRCPASFADNRPEDKRRGDTSNAKANLKKQLISALKIIIAKRPKRPRELETKSPEEVKRDRDIEHLKRLFSYLSPKMLDHFIDRLGYGRITKEGTEFYAGFHDTYYSNSFQLYDAKLARLTKAFIDKWGDCLRYTGAMDSNSDCSELFFLMPGDIPKTNEQLEQHKQTALSRYPLAKALKALLAYVHSNYLEIDIVHCGEAALKSYREAD
jgi:hypothetical protein